VALALITTVPVARAVAIPDTPMTSATCKLPIATFNLLPVTGTFALPMNDKVPVFTLSLLPVL
jgi:hypothetical protein